MATRMRLLLGIAILAMAYSADASVEKAKTDEVGSLAGDAVSFLQQGLEIRSDVEAPHVRAPGKSVRAEWFAWDERIPIFSAGEGNEAVNNSEFVKVWTYLADEWWLEFIDGKFHQDGPHALDHTEENMKWGMDGDFHGHAREAYELFSAPDQWDILWTADEFGHTNARYRGRECEDPQCLDMYAHDLWTLSRRLQPGGRPQSQKQYAQSTHDKLDSIFAEYYRAVSSLQGEVRHVRLQSGIMHLTNLFVDLARLHPFDDANSRIRLLAFQTEIVRLGGHPVVLWDLRETVYAICPPEAADPLGVFEASDSPCDEAERKQIQDLLLDGWCTWEVAASTGLSPFLDGTHPSFYDASTGSCIPSGVASG